MQKITRFRLYLLRAIYILIAIGLILTIWPEIIFPHSRLANQESVINSLLGALALIALLGIRYPLKMLPVLLFELLWKLIWIFGFAIPMSISPGLDTYAAETLFACLIGVVLVPLAIPWSYVYNKYILPDKV